MSTKIYDINGVLMKFNFEAFKTVFNTYHRSKNLKVHDLEQTIADEMKVSIATVHNWRCGKNGPMGIQEIKELAACIELNDYMILLKETDGENKMMQLTDRQKVSAKKIYDICLRFMDDFEHTDGFNDYWLEFKDAGSKDPERDSYDRVLGMMRKLFLVYDQEYFDLHGHPIYDELGEFIGNGLYDTFDGKLSYAYRFEAAVDGHPTVSEDYDKAMIALNSIIEKYL